LLNGGGRAAAEQEGQYKRPNLFHLSPPIAACFADGSAPVNRFG
jgi:hypothetical protein